MSEMLKYYSIIKDKLRSKDNKVLFENFISLVFLQIANYALPLITIPYLAYTLGVEVYGLVAGAQYLIQYFMMITDYGFNFSATRLVSIHREDKTKISAIFSAVMIIKIVIMFICLLAVLSIVFFTEKYSDDPMVYLATFGLVIGNLIFPVWLFQGFEKMKIVTIINVVTKLIFTICIFIFVQSSDDYLMVPILTSLGFLISGLISFFVVRKLGVRFIFPGWEEIRFQLVDGWHVFISTISATMYMASNGFLLDVLTNNPIYVGYYSAGEKVIRAFASLFSPVSVALYPFISKKLHENKKSGIELFMKFVKVVGVLSLLVSIGVLFLGEWITNLLLGPDFSGSIVVMQILCVIPFFGTIGAMFAYQLFINIGLKHLIPRILVIAFTLDISLNFLLIPTLHHIGAAIALGVTEVFVPVAFLSYYFLNAKRLQNG
jgi:PST family polysaccharide transporter